MNPGGGSPSPTTIPGVELTDEMLDAPEPAAMVERLATAEQMLDLGSIDPDKVGVTEGVVNGERVKVVTGTPPPVRRRQSLEGLGGPGYSPPPLMDPLAPPVRTPQPASPRLGGLHVHDEFDLVGPSPPPPPLTPASRTRIGRPPQSTPPPDERTEERPPASERRRAGLWMGVGLTGLMAAAILLIVLVIVSALIFAVGRTRGEPAPAAPIPVPVMIPTLPVHEVAPAARPEFEAMPEAVPEAEPSARPEPEAEPEVEAEVEPE